MTISSIMIPVFKPIELEETRVIKIEPHKEINWTRDPTFACYGKINYSKNKSLPEISWDVNNFPIWNP